MFCSIPPLEILCYRTLDKPRHTHFFKKVIKELLFIFENAVVAPESQCIYKTITTKKKIKFLCPKICFITPSYNYNIHWSWDLNRQSIINRQVTLHLPLPIEYTQ